MPELSPSDCACPLLCVYHPANFGQQIAARGGLPRDLAARIDAIERHELPLIDEALAWAMAGHQDDYGLEHRCDYKCAELIGVYYRRFGQ